MNRDSKKKVAGMAVTVALSITAMGAAKASEYGWCWTAPLDSSNRKMFYSGVFSVPSADTQYILDGQFGEYVRRGYRSDGTGPGQCRLYNDERSAQRYLDQARDNSANSDRLQVIDLSWNP